MAYHHFCLTCVGIALRIYLTMPVSVATGERSFSKLKIVKNYLRSTMNQDRLTNLSIISIEHQLCQSVDTKSLIEKFSAIKARKVHFVKFKKTFI